uniref:Odorant receptor n=2 Tax=Conopomorpha sinensis TaxID=940481 RepID=A0AAU8BC46_9NEOP
MTIVLTEEEYDLPPTIHLRFMKIVIGLLGSIGAWPGEVFSTNLSYYGRFLKYFLPAQVSFIVIGLLNHMYLHLKQQDLFLKAHDAVIFIVMSMTLLRVIQRLFKSYGQSIKKFLGKYHLYYMQDESDYHLYMYNYVNKVSLYFMYVELGTIIGIPFSICSLYAFINYRNGMFSSNRPANVTLEQLGHWVVPVINYYPGLFMAQVVDYFGTTFASFSVLALDCLIVLMVFNLIGHLYILVNEVDCLAITSKDTGQTTTDDPTKLMYDNDENEIMRKRIIKVIHHHRHTVEFCNMISTFGGPALLSNLAYDLMCGCLLLVLTTTLEIDKAARFIVVLVSTFTQLIVIASVFEMVVTASNKLPAAVYLCPWEKANYSNRRALLFVLKIVQIPLQVKALDMVPMGFATMTSILKTTFSYYAFLRKLAD